jgi:hypothetical protein
VPPWGVQQRCACKRCACPPGRDAFSQDPPSPSAGSTFCQVVYKVKTNVPIARTNRVGASSYARHHFAQLIGGSNMRYRRCFLLLILATTGMLVYATVPAAAQGATVLLRPNPANSAQSVQVFGTGFCPSPCAPATVRVDNNVIATVSADARGQFSTTITAPVLAGFYTVRVTQLRGHTPIEASDSLTVGTTDTNLQGPGPTAGPPAAEPPTTLSPPKGEHTRATTATSTSAKRVAPLGKAAPTTVSSRAHNSSVATNAAASARADTTHDNSPLPWVLLGAAVVAAAALGALVFARRRAHAR